MKFSIIIPVYNSEKYLKRCLDSLINQDLSINEYEIIIINDGSMDASLAISNNYAKKHLNIRIFSQQNSGVGSARNRGISKAKGNYIYFIDPDDYLASNVLRILIDLCDKNELEILTFLSEETTRSNSIDSTTENLMLKPIVFSGIDYIDEFWYNNEVWWYIIKRGFLQETKLKFITGRWMEDAIFTAKLFLKAKAIAHVPFDIHRHVITTNSAMTSREPKHYLKVIRDNANAAIVFDSLIDYVKTKEPDKILGINRLKARQQSFVFFMMVRMLKSSIKLKEVKTILKNMSAINAYPLNSFLGKDYHGFFYSILTKLFNYKHIFYLIFLTLNPVLKIKYPWFKKILKIYILFFGYSPYFLIYY